MFSWLGVNLHYKMDCYTENINISLLKTWKNRTTSVIIVRVPVSISPCLIVGISAITRVKFSYLRTHHLAYSSTLDKGRVGNVKDKRNEELSGYPILIRRFWSNTGWDLQPEPFGGLKLLSSQCQDATIKRVWIYELCWMTTKELAFDMFLDLE